jgi:hypothetical protein
MMIASQIADTGVEEGIRHLTEEETWALFDELVRERLGISGAEFKQRLVAGEYNEIADDVFNYPGLMTLVMFVQHVDEDARSYRHGHR